LWVHHWVILQFVHPHFSVGIKQKLDDNNPDGTSVFQFKHDNWKEFVTSMDDEMLTNYYERHETYPNFGLVWIGHHIL
jgi:hypothetical protein